MAPEQTTGEKPVDTRADMYALGAVLYETLAGEPPLNGFVCDLPPSPRARYSLPPAHRGLDNDPETCLLRRSARHHREHRARPAHRRRQLRGRAEAVPHRCED